VAYLAQSTRATWLTSDGASNVLQAWDMLHGNLLLTGWTVSDVSFYTIDLPEYMLVDAIRGVGPDVTHIGAAATYTLLVLLAAWLAKGQAAGREGIARALTGAGIMLAPQLAGPTGVLLSSPDHVATGVPLLITWLVVDRPAGSASGAGGAGGNRWRWVAPVLVGVLLAWTIVGDRIAEVIGALPLAAVCLLRIGLALWRGGDPAAGGARRRLRDLWFELSLLAAAGLSVPVAWAATRLIAGAGGWNSQPLQTTLAGWGALGHNAVLTGQGILEVFGAGFNVQPGTRAAVFAGLHLIGLALVAGAILLALRRYLARDQDLVVQILVAAIAANLAAYLAGIQAQDITNTREIVAVLPFGAALAGRLLGGYLVRPRLAAPMAAVLAISAGMLVFDAVQPPVQASPMADVAHWLAAHGLTRGLAGYWQANSVTVDSGNRVQVRAVGESPVGGLTGRTWWEDDQAWYAPGTTATFLISVGPFAQWRQQPLIQQMVAQAGQPAAVYDVDQYTVAVWKQNLMAKLH
jgi:hypothetical protein